MQAIDDGTRLFWVWEQTKAKCPTVNALSHGCTSEAVRVTGPKPSLSVRQALDLFLCQGFRMAYSSAPRMWAVLGRWFI